jgi:cell division protein FtsQ
VNKRKSRAGLGRWLVTTVLLAGIAYGGAVAARDPRLALTHVVVLGAVHTPADEIERAASLALGQNVWLLDAGAAAHRVASLPWVASARVRRSWPNHVAIEVSERAPVARLTLPDGGTAEEPTEREALIDDTLHVIAVGMPDAAEAGLPVLRVMPTPPGVAPGADERGSDVEEAYDALVQLRALGLRISEVDLAPATGIAVSTAGRMRVLFGTNDDLAKKVSLYQAIALKIVAPEDVVYVDLRSTRAPTVLYR